MKAQQLALDHTKRKIIVQKYSVNIIRNKVFKEIYLNILNIVLISTKSCKNKAYNNHLTYLLKAAAICHVSDLSSIGITESFTHKLLF